LKNILLLIEMRHRGHRKKSSSLMKRDSNADDEPYFQITEGGEVAMREEH